MIIDGNQKTIAEVSENKNSRMNFMMKVILSCFFYLLNIFIVYFSSKNQTIIRFVQEKHIIKKVKKKIPNFSFISAWQKIVLLIT